MKKDKNTLIDVVFATGAAVFMLVAVMTAMSADALCVVSLIGIIGGLSIGLSEN